MITEITDIHASDFLSQHESLIGKKVKITSKYLKKSVVKGYFSGFAVLINPVKGLKKFLYFTAVKFKDFLVREKEAIMQNLPPGWKREIQNILMIIRGKKLSSPEEQERKKYIFTSIVIFVELLVLSFKLDLAVVEFFHDENGIYLGFIITVFLLLIARVV